MSRKLSAITNNIIVLVVAVIVLAVIAAAVFYWAPWKSVVDNALIHKAASRDSNSIVIACKNEPPGLNPYSSTDQSVTQLSQVLFSGLTAFDENGNAVPDLADVVPTAESGLLSSDGKTVTYRLRNAKWSDGKTFVAADVAATWRYIMTSKKTVRRDGYELISSIDTADPQLVVIHFKQYYPEYLTLFPVVLPAHILAEDAEKLERAPVGTGPYKLKEWFLGDCLLLEANETYFGGKPKIANMKVRFIAENKLLLAQLKAGDVDLAADIDLQQLELVREIKNYEIKTAPTLELTRLDFNCADKLLQNSSVRNALAMTVDKKHICHDLLSGAALQTTSYIAPFSKYYNHDIVDKHEPQAAQSALAAAGWILAPDGDAPKKNGKVRLELLVNADNALRAVVAENIAAGFCDAGVDAVVLKVSAGDFVSRLKTGRYQIALYAILMYPDYDPSVFWNPASIPVAERGGGMNYPRFKDERITRLVTQISAPGADSQKKENYLILQRYLNQEMPSLPIYYRQSVDVVRKGLQNFLPGVTLSGGYRNAHLWQW